MISQKRKELQASNSHIKDFIERNNKAKLLSFYSEFDVFFYKLDCQKSLFDSDFFINLLLQSSEGQRLLTFYGS